MIKLIELIQTTNETTLSNLALFTEKPLKLEQRCTQIYSNKEKRRKKSKNVMF